MNLFKKVLISLFVITSTVIIISCSETDGKQPSVDEKSKRAVNVEVESLAGSQFTDYISVIGTIKPINAAKLSYLPGGIIKEIRIDKGQYARKGDTILVIDNDVLIANYNAAKANYELAQVTFEKQAQIFKEKVGSEFQYLQAKYNCDASKANYQLMKAQLEDTYVKAPFSGIVDAKYFEVGELAGPGAPIINLIDRNTLKIEAGVSERYVGRVKKGGIAKVYIETQKDPILGKVSFVGSSVRTDNRTFPVELVIKNKSITLKPEMVAEVYIENGIYNDLITIPDDVVTRSDNAYTVYIAENGKAVSKEIEILARYQNEVAVSSGLVEGDKLITVGYQNLTDGESINIVK